MDQIRKNIKTFRQQRGWNQQKVAELLNISVPAFSKIETGITDVSLSRLYQLSNIFDISLQELIIKDKEQPNKLKSEMIEKLSSELSSKNQEISILLMKVIDLYEELRNKDF